MNKDSPFKKSFCSSKSDLVSFLSPIGTNTKTVELQTFQNGKKMPESVSSSTLKKSMARNFNAPQSSLLLEPGLANTSPTNSDKPQFFLNDRKNSSSNANLSLLNFKPEPNCFSIQTKKCAELASFEQQK